MQAPDDNLDLPLSTMEIWKRRLNSPLRMALFVIGLLLATGLLAVYMPLSSEIQLAEARIQRAEGRRQLARSVEELRRQAALYARCVPHGEDLNDWTEYLHRGIAQTHVTLLRMDPRDAEPAAPGKLLRWQLDLEGSFASLGAFVDWVEHGERIAAIEKIVLQPSREGMRMSVTICALVL